MIRDRADALIGETSDDGGGGDLTQFLDGWVPSWLRTFLWVATLVGLMGWAVMQLGLGEGSDADAGPAVRAGTVEVGGCYDLSTTGVPLERPCVGSHEFEVVGFVEVDTTVVAGTTGAGVIGLEIACQDAFLSHTGVLPDSRLALQADLPTGSGVSEVACRVHDARGMPLVAPVAELVSR
jgi:hypothetical protein